MHAICHDILIVNKHQRRDIEWRKETAYSFHWSGRISFIGR